MWADKTTEHIFLLLHSTHNLCVKHRSISVKAHPKVTHEKILQHLKNKKSFSHQNKCTSEKDSKLVFFLKSHSNLGPSRNASDFPKDCKIVHFEHSEKVHLKGFIKEYIDNLKEIMCSTCSSDCTEYFYQACTQKIKRLFHPKSP